MQDGGGRRERKEEAATATAEAASHHPAASAASAAPGCGKRNIINHSPPDSKITETNECCCCRGERWKGKMRKNFTSSPIMHITRRKSQKSMQKRNVGSVSGADADGRAMNIFGSLSFFGVRPHKPPLLRACFMLTDRPPVGGRAAGRHSVARGSCVWRQVSRPR